MTHQRAPILAIIPSISASIDGVELLLDEKAVSGLRLYAEFWPGSVRVIFREGPRANIVFGQSYDARDLPFEVRVIPAGSLVSDIDISDAAVLLASGDNHLDFPIAEQGARLNIPVSFVIEYILGTRLKILFISNFGFLKKAKSALWTLKSEFERRRAFKNAEAIQSNGTPANDAYGKYVDSAITFFDTRLSNAQMISGPELDRKICCVQKMEPIRLIYTGRLERMKGVDHLVEVARRLRVPFSLDIYGSGDLAPLICDQIARFSLANNVRLHEPIDFTTALIPLLKSRADLFVCCHVQSDPSCTYLETLGCGVPIIGFANKAWSGILSMADVGWQIPIGKPDLMAAQIAHLSSQRHELVKKIYNAADFAADHSAEKEFNLRVDQLLAVSKANRLLL